MDKKVQDERKQSKNWAYEEDLFSLLVGKFVASD